MPNRTPLAELLELRGNLEIAALESAAIAGNALGDPAVRPLPVYTPPGYDPQGSARYPVLYALHGYTGSAGALLAARPWERNVVQWVDLLIAQGRMPPVILAAVDGFTRLGGSQYVDSIHNGAYARYVTQEAVAHVDRHFRTIAREAGRAVFGKSSGGFGALHLVMEHPGGFAAVASHSGDAHFALAHPPGLVQMHRTLESFGWEIERFVEQFESAHKRPQAWYAAMEMLGYSAAYSPCGSNAWEFDLPVVRETGAIDEEVFRRWRSFDPVERVAERQSELHRLRLRYLDCGRRDEYALDVGARMLAARMRDLGLEVRHEEFDDDHRNIGYRYEISLPAMAAVLERET